MKKNMGNVDRGVRILIAVTVAILFGTNVISGALAIVLIVVSGVFLLTSFVNWCPIYAALGLRSCKADADGNCA